MNADAHAQSIFQMFTIETEIISIETNLEIQSSSLLFRTVPALGARPSADIVMNI